MDMTNVREIYVDATFNMSKTSSHLFAIVAQELGYSTPLAFMLMEIHPRENTKNEKHDGEAYECNLNFYAAGERLGLHPTFVHTDKDFAEINAAKVCFLLSHSSIDAARAELAG